MEIKQFFFSPTVLKNKSAYENNHTKYYKTDSGKILGITNRVIFKTTKELDKKELQEFKNTQSVQQIGKLDGFDIYLVTISPEVNIFDYIKKIRNENIITSTPDLLIVNKKYTFYEEEKISIMTYLDVSELRKYGDGKGVNIAIIDDGFDLSHSEFKDIKVKFSYDVDSKTLDVTPKNRVDTHGTKVTGVIFANDKIEGTSPNANLIAIRQTSNWISDMIIAFNIADMADADIINCSWSLPYLSEPLKNIIDEISKRGKYIVFSAGNDSCDIDECNPISALDSVISVGSILSNGKLTKYSNFGEKVDFLTISNVKTISKKGYTKLSGTSASAPIITGVLANILSKNRTKNKSNILKILKKKSIMGLYKDR